MLNKNKLIISAHQDFLQELENNKNKLKSLSLSNKIIKALKDKKYNLSDFELYKYIKVSDFLWLNGKYSISLSSGINLNWNKFRNVLVDSYYHDIPKEMFYEMSISSLFQFKYKDNDIFPTPIKESSLSEWDLQLLEINYVKNNHDLYFGNYRTYVTLKELFKIYFEETDLYYYRGRVYSDNQLENNYNTFNSHYKKNGSNWWLISKYDPELIILKYKLLSLDSPKDIMKDSLSKIDLKFILQNTDSKYDPYYIKNLRLKDLWINKKE